MGTPADAANSDRLRRNETDALPATSIAPANVAQARVAGPSLPGWHATYARWLLLTDLVAVLAAVEIAQAVRFGSSPSTVSAVLLPRVTYTEISIMIAIGWMAALAINGARSTRVIGSGIEEYRRVWWTTILVFGGVAIISMLLKLEIARGYLMIALPTGVVLLLMSRWVARRVVLWARKHHGRCVTRLLVVGSPEAVRDLTLGFSREPGSGYDIVGACIPGQYARPNIGVPGIGTVPVLGDESSVARAAVASGSHAVAVAASDRFHGTGLRRLSWELENLDIDLLVAPGVIDVAGSRLHMRPVAGLPLIHIEKPQYNGAKRFQKRAFDVSFSGMALVCGVPFLLLIALAVKLSSRGPVFYRQKRIGLNGEPFEMIKFRTMVVGADAMLEEIAHLNESGSGVLFKIRKDPRVTPLGRFLRKYSLDELPSSSTCSPVR